MSIKITRNAGAPAKKPVTASQSITSSVRNNRAATPVMAGMQALTPSQRAFARQLQSNIRRSSAVMGATNTANIMAKPEFMELLPMFVQKLLILDVFGSVAMKSRQQLVPYFKFIAENTKGETKAGDVISSPFVNRLGVDPNFGGRFVKNEVLSDSIAAEDAIMATYTPVLPGSVTINVTDADGNTTPYVDDGNGNLKGQDGTDVGYIKYDDGTINLDGIDGAAKISYQYDNENVGHGDVSAHGQYGAQMGKGYLQLDEFNLVAEAHQLACYWSIYSAFAAQQEYGANIGDIAKEAAFAELTAEINSQGFATLAKAAKYNPQFNWDASPVLSGAVVPSDYLNMFKLKLGQAAASIYQKTRLARPNRLVVGTTAAEYIAMINGFKAENYQDEVGPYRFGTLDQFEVYVDPNYEPTKWVMACKSNDIRRNSALFGEYMPLTNTDAIGLANASVQQGYATMYAMKVVNPDTVVSGKILGAF